MSFFGELKRRHVFRVATAYVIISWLVMQVVDVMSPALLLPDWIASLFAVILIIGFPITMVLSWVYDVTPEGVVRTDAADNPDSNSPRRLDVLIAVGLVVVGGLIVWQQLSQDSTNALSEISNSAVAVLPFEDLSPEGNQQYFADGISEEILNKLSRDSNIAITGRTSSFAFRGSGKTLQEIGATLNVGVLLEGSVRKQGERVRIVARLIRAADGMPVWNHTYETELSDIFALQDEIALQVLDELSITMDEAPSRRTRAGSIQAYDLFLQARELVVSRRLDAIIEAKTLLDKAIVLDPEFAPPYAELALTERLLSIAPGGLGRQPVEESRQRAEAYADRALALDPELADAHAIAGWLDIDSHDLLAGEVSLRRALELNPSHENARLWLALGLQGNARFNDAAKELEQLFAVDPLLTPVSFNLTTLLTTTNNAERIKEVIARLERLEALEEDVAQAQFVYARYQGNFAEAVNILAPVWDENATTTLGANISLALLKIGAGASAERYRLPFVPIRNALSAGDYDSAVATARAVLEFSPTVSVFKRELAVTLAAAKQDAGLLDWYEETFDSDPASFERAMFWPFGTEPAPFYAIAYAMHRSENKTHFEALIARWRQAIDIGRANGADSQAYDLDDARWYAVNGQAEEAVTLLQQAANRMNGLIGNELSYDYLHTLLAGQPQFEQIAAINDARMREERELLSQSGFDIL
ncbi:MAG: hypothetical protein AAF004_15490 [Pseudomonadota bacterium]